MLRQRGKLPQCLRGNRWRHVAMKATREFVVSRMDALGATVEPHLAQNPIGNRTVVEYDSSLIYATDFADV